MDVGDEGSSLAKLRVWDHSVWNLEGNLDLWGLGRNLMSFELERASEVEKGMRKLSIMVLGLERWIPSVGCVGPWENEKEVCCAATYER